MFKTDFDLVIAGAGLAGINAAYRFQNEAPKGMTYAVLEARDSIGGTWDLFRYPGLRADIDMYTYGFAWKPWSRKETIAMGPEIKNYIQKAATETGIDSNIRLNHKIKTANWVCEAQVWEVTTHVHGVQENPVVYYARFLYLCTGYYDYGEPLRVTIPGIERFEGEVIHPQFWPETFDYTDKEVVVIGSGATAVTIVPAIAGRVKHVTMLQRSPSYIVSLPQYDKLAVLLSKFLPHQLAHMLNRWVWILKGYAFDRFCSWAPKVVKEFIRQDNLTHLPPEIPWDPHFNPRYNPGDQRLCVTMNGDLFKALGSGKASVVTDTIDEITAKGIRLTSGRELTPDVIITATGLKLLLGGKIHLTIDGEEVNPANRFLWKATMLQDVPNLFLNIGYDQATWTLSCDCAAYIMVRVVRQLQQNAAKVAYPRMDGDVAAKMPRVSIFTLKSTYLRGADESLPKVGTGVWAPRRDYYSAFCQAVYGDIRTNLIME